MKTIRQEAIREPIFRLVEGKLIPIQQRDPARRYGAVSGSGGTYLKEFTDEEEKQRDLEEKAWTAEAPRRAAEELRQKEERQALEDTFKYEEKFFAFIDILGWSSAVKKSSSDKTGQDIRELGIALFNLIALVKHNNEVRKIAANVGSASGFMGNCMISQFSDCMVISASPDREGREVLIGHLWFICKTMLLKGLLLRGGIVQGQIYHTDEGVYGPALIEAFQLENEVAKQPRIILSQTLAAQWGRGEDYGAEGLARTWRLDKDGYSFFDFMQPLGGSPTFVRSRSWTSDLQRLREIAIKGLNIHRNTEIVSKYEWLADYVNSLRQQCAEFGLETVEPITHHTKTDEY